MSSSSILSLLISSSNCWLSFDSVIFTSSSGALFPMYKLPELMSRVFPHIFLGIPYLVKKLPGKTPQKFSRSFHISLVAEK